MVQKKQQKAKPPKAGKPARSQSEVQTIRKAQGMKIARMILWVMLAFVFLRGVVAIFRGGMNDSAEELEQYRQENEAARTRIEQLLPFAEDFARDYLTYSPGGEQDYQQRMNAYATKNLFSGVRVGNATAEAVSATAYRHEAYSETQEDVWVRLTVRYTIKNRNPETGESVETQEFRETTLKVPVACTDSGFVVEDFPAFVTDERKAQDYKAESYSGASADRATQDAVKTALEGFFRAYYAENQGVIQYYLTPDADVSDFLGLNGRVTFQRVSECRVYIPEGTGTLLAIVSVEVTDANGLTVPQRFHMELLRQDGQFHVRNMNVRSKNI